MYEEDGEVRVNVGDEPEVAVIPGSNHQYQLDSGDMGKDSTYLKLPFLLVCNTKYDKSTKDILASYKTSIPRYTLGSRSGAAKKSFCSE